MEAEIKVTPDMQAEKRIDYLRTSDSFFVFHPQIEEIFDVYDAVRKQRKRSRTTGLTLIGDSGSGKTTMTKAYIRERGHAKVFHADFIERPVDIVRMPPATRPTAFFERILRTYEESENGTIPQKEHRVFNTLEVSKTQLLFIDEIHNVLNSGGHNTQEFMLKVLKDVANECKIPFILMGTEEALEVLKLNAEVKRRFPPLILKNFEEVNREFQELLAGFEERLPLRKSSSLASNKRVTRAIFKYSKGLIVDISAIIRASAIFAIQTGSERITPTEIKGGKELLEKRLVLE
jgi:GTPase SAR1 family protein